MNGNTIISDLLFTYDSATGNLLSRESTSGASETFTYDNLDRLTSAGGQTYSYADNGNLTYKTGIGHYTYGNVRPHAVKSIENTDCLMAMSRLDTEYNTFGKISRIHDHETGRSLDILYGIDDERYLSIQRYGDGSIEHEVIYLDGLDLRIDWDGYQKWTYYPEDHVITKRNDNGAFNHYYTFTDQVGSILKAVDANGTVKFSATYDPWGRQTITSNQLNLVRGYTGHEMLTEYGLINMNGRLYDPLLGRFLSTDNFVQEPGSTQSFNRYSYCLNNPLIYNDPTGDIPALVVVGAIVIGGVTNVAINSSEIHDVWHGIASFAIGSASSGLSLVGLPALGAIVAGAGNSIVNQTFNNGTIDLGAVITSTGLSLMTYGVGEKIGKVLDKPISNITDKIKNKILQITTKKAIHGALGGLIIGTGFGLQSGDIGDALLEGAKYSVQGAIIGGLNGLNEGYATNKQNGQVWCQDNREEIIDALDLRQTIRRIDQGQILQNYRHDGTTFDNRDRILPNGSAPFKEWVVPRGLPNNRPGAERIVTGSNGEMWYTPDHYENFIRIR